MSYHWLPHNFKVGDRVLMQDSAPTGTKLWNKEAVVVNIRESGDSYTVEDDDGDTYE